MLKIRTKRINGLEFLNNLCAVILVARYAFTPFVRFDTSVAVKYIIVALWLITAIANDKGLIYRARKIIIFLVVVLFLNVLLYITSGSNFNLIRYRSQTFFFFFWQIMFEYYKNKKLDIKKISWVFIPLLTLSCYYTLTGNLHYFHASRQLAGLANSQQIALYYSNNIGGYGFIYFLSFLIPLLYLAYKNKLNGKLSMLHIVLVVLSVATIIISDYTTALLVSAALLIYAFFFTESKYKFIYTFLILIAVSIVAVFGSQLLELLKNFFTNINSRMIVTRIEQLQMASQRGESIERFQLYKNGLLNFMDRPLWGVPQDSELLRYSNHSEIICYLERFGLIGIFYPFMLFADYKGVVVSLKSNIYKSFYRAIMIALLIFAAINRVDTAPEISLAVYLIIPLCLIYLENRDTEYLETRS